MMKGLMIGCMVLAFITAVFYLLLAAGIITVPSLASKDWQHVLIYVAAGCYILGGLLILAKNLVMGYRPCDEYTGNGLFFHNVQKQSGCHAQLTRAGDKNTPDNIGSWFGLPDSHIP